MATSRSRRACGADGVAGGCVLSLTASDKHFWEPIYQVVHWLSDRLPPDAKVLEIGPHRFQFPRATTFVDCVERPELPADKLVICDVGTEPLPFPDKSFDFVYCRHVLEDLFSPFLLCREMDRVARAGYVETPSPAAELCRGIDGFVDGEVVGWRGYHHHRYFVWSHHGELRFVAKYPVIEHLNIHDEVLGNILRPSPKYWNNYHLWEGKLDWSHRQNAIDFDVMRDYEKMLSDAVNQSNASANAFWANVPVKVEMPAMRKAFA